MVLPIGRKPVPVNRDSTDPCDHTAKVVVVRFYLGRQYQHRVVKSKFGFRGRGSPQSLNTLRSPTLLLLRFGRFGCGNRDHDRKNNGKKLHTAPQWSGGILPPVRSQNRKADKTPNFKISCEPGSARLKTRDLLAGPLQHNLVDVPLA